MKQNAKIRFTARCVSLIASVVSICGIGTNAFCITIDSSDFRTWGNWSESWGILGGDSYHVSDSFSSTRTDGQPLSTFVQSNPHQWNSASCSLDSFDLSMSANSAAWNPFYGGPSSGTSIGINAVGTTLFHVASTKLAITLNAYSFWDYFPFEQDMQVILRDVTTSATLLNVDHLDEPNENRISASYNLDVDPSHEYEFTISGWIGAYDAKYANMSAQVQIGETIPDSGMTLVLLAGSLSALLWAKKVSRVFRLAWSPARHDQRWLPYEVNSASE
jgi:hypothetical protein